MKKKPTLLVLLSTVSLSFLTLFHFPVVAYSMVIRVPADYPTIQLAIDTAAPGDIIFVSSGIYYEHVVVNKTLTLIGEDRDTTVIDGIGAGTVVAITADNVLIDGFTVRNTSDYGIYLNYSEGSKMCNNIVTMNGYGIFLNNSNSTTIANNNITENGGGGDGLQWGGGVQLLYSDDNIIDGNVVTNNVASLIVYSSNNNSVSDNILSKSVFLDYSNGNSITNNVGTSGGLSFDLQYSDNNTIVGNTMSSELNQIIRLEYSNCNVIYHNNFINLDPAAGGGVHLYKSLSVWDNGLEGNYWSGYTGLDDGSGGRVAGDGVGDTDLPHLEVDYYPLVTPWGPIPVLWDGATYPVKLLSNSTVSTFLFMQAWEKIRFDVRGPSDTIGYCNVTIPKNLLRGDPWKVFLNSTNITSQAIITENQTHTSIYFTYVHGTYELKIYGTEVIPEFPTAIVLLLFIAFTVCAIVLKEKIKHQTC